MLNRFLVYEYCEKGDLNGIMIRNRECDPSKLIELPSMVDVVCLFSLRNEQ